MSVSALPAVQGFSLATMGEHVFVPQAFSNPGELGEVAHGYGAVGSPLPETLQDVAVFDAEHGTSNRGGKPFAIMHGWSHVRKNLCRLPRAAAVDADNQSLLVACHGSDRVLELDAMARDPARAELAVFSVARGPVAIAIEPLRREAYVWSRYARKLSVLQLSPVTQEQRPGELSFAGMQRRRRTTPAGVVLREFDVPPLGLPDAEASLTLLGRALFHSANNPAISLDGRACASCHPAARDDGLSWRTAGLLAARQTPMLDGRIEGTAPYGWLGQHKTLDEHLTNTVSHRLHGIGLPASELAALVHFLRTLPGPPRPTRALNAVEARGEALYHRSDVGCGDCHDPDGSVDGLQHSVTALIETDTPSLRFIGGAAPYFHHGRYASLDDVILHTRDVMGQTGPPLSQQERTELVAYLKTL